MKYRIYVYTNKGYELLESNLSKERMLVALDHLILQMNYDNKILVIEHNIKENYDNPIYMYLGNIEKYLEYKAQFTEKKLVK